MRPVETAESYAGSKIVLPEVVRDRLANQQVEILACGEPSVCNDDDCERPHVQTLTERVHVVHGKTGDWVLVAPRSLVECGDPDGKTFLVRHDDMIAVLTS